MAVAFQERVAAFRGIVGFGAPWARPRITWRGEGEGRVRGRGGEEDLGRGGEVEELGGGVQEPALKRTERVTCMGEARRAAWQQGGHWAWGSPMCHGGLWTIAPPRAGAHE